MIMCCLARLVMKAGVIRRCFCFLLLLLRSHLGHSTRAMGQALSELGSREPTTSLCTTGKHSTPAKLLLLPLLLLPVFSRSDCHGVQGCAMATPQHPAESQEGGWAARTCWCHCTACFCLCLLGQSDTDPPPWVMVTHSLGSLTPGLAFPSTKNFWWHSLGVALGFGVLGEGPVPAAPLPRVLFEV